MYFRQRLIPSLYKPPAALSGSVSLAALLAGAETQALALDFTDNRFQADTGHYGSAYVLDTGTPANNYDSHPYGKLTYTSPSAKMTLGPSGTLRFGAHNLFLQSSTFDNASWTKSATTVTASGESNPYNSGAVFNLTPSTTGTFRALAQSVTVPNGVSHSISIVAKANGITHLSIYGDNDAFAYAQVWFNLSNGTVGTQSGATGSISALGNGWYLCTLTRTTATSGASGVIRLQLADGDNSQTATASGSNGVLVSRAQIYRNPSDSTYLATTSAARYALPFEWDSNGNNLGILVEEARTNLFTQSDGVTSGWAGFNGTLTTAAGTDIRGLTKAARYVENSDPNCPHEVYLSSGGSGGVAYAYSVYVKADTHSTIFLSAYTAANNYIAAVYDLSGVSVSETNVGSSGGTIVSTAIRSAGNGWYRCVIVGTLSGALNEFRVGTAANTSGNAWDAAGQEKHNGNGTRSFYFCLPQMEAGACETSAIPTLGSTVTRAADNISLATSAFPWSATTDTIYARVQRTATIAAIIFEVSDGTDNERNVVYDNGSATAVNLVMDGGSPQVADNIGSLTVAEFDVAVAFAANNFAASLDGSIIADSSGTLPTVNRLYIGTAHGIYPWCGYIRRMLIVPRRMSNAELQVLTT